MLQSYSDSLGMVHYSLTEHEKVTVITLPLRDGILCLSATPTTNINKIHESNESAQEQDKQHSQQDKTTRKEKLA